MAIADLSPLARQKEQRAWYWYDWANSGYVTTVATVLFARVLLVLIVTIGSDPETSCYYRNTAPILAQQRWGELGQ